MKRTPWFGIEFVHSGSPHLGVSVNKPLEFRFSDKTTITNINGDTDTLITQPNQQSEWKKFQRNEIGIKTTLNLQSHGSLTWLLSLSNLMDNPLVWTYSHAKDNVLLASICKDWAEAEVKDQTAPAPLQFDVLIYKFYIIYIIWKEQHQPSYHIILLSQRQAALPSTSPNSSGLNISGVS